MNLYAELESIFAEVASLQEEDNRLQQNITANADAINALAESAPANKVHSATNRAIAVGKILQLIFGIRDDRIITNEFSGYAERKQMNW